MESEVHTSSYGRSHAAVLPRAACRYLTCTAHVVPEDEDQDTGAGHVERATPDVGYPRPQTISRALSNTRKRIRSFDLAHAAVAYRARPPT